MRALDRLTPDEYIGLQIRKLRGLDKQDTLVRELNKRGLKLSRTRLSYLEHGKSKMNVRELEVFCEYFGVEPSYFFQPKPEDKDDKQDILCQEKMVLS